MQKKPNGNNITVALYSAGSFEKSSAKIKSSSVDFHILGLRAIMSSFLVPEFCGSNLGPIKSDKVLPTARHRCYNLSNEAVQFGPNDAEIGTAHWLDQCFSTAALGYRFCSSH